MRYQVRCLAPAVNELGRDGRVVHGTVRFARPAMAYVETAELVVAVEHDGRPRSPNGLYIDDTVDLARWRVGTSVRIRAGCLQIADDLLVWTLGTPRFDGSVGPLPASPEVFASALTHGLRVAAGEQCGVCRLVAGAEYWRRPLVLAALHSLALRSTGDHMVKDQRDSLLGLGPGLTPATDDLICGTILAQHALGVRLDDALAAAPLSAAAGVATTAVSTTWLRLAAEGQAIEPLQDVLRVAPDSGTWNPALARLLAVGSTTGHSLRLGATLGVLGLSDGSTVKACSRGDGERCHA